MVRSPFSSQEECTCAVLAPCNDIVALYFRLCVCSYLHLHTTMSKSKLRDSNSQPLPYCRNSYVALYNEPLPLAKVAVALSSRFIVPVHSRLQNILPPITSRTSLRTTRRAGRLHACQKRCEAAVRRVVVVDGGRMIRRPCDADARGVHAHFGYREGKALQERFRSSCLHVKHAARVFCAARQFLPHREPSASCVLLIEFVERGHISYHDIESDRVTNEGRLRTTLIFATKQNTKTLFE